MYTCVYIYDACGRHNPRHTDAGIAIHSLYGRIIMSRVCTPFYMTNSTYKLHRSSRRSKTRKYAQYTCMHLVCWSQPGHSCGVLRLIEMCGMSHVFPHTCDMSTAPCLHATVLTVSLVSFAKTRSETVVCFHGNRQIVRPRQFVWSFRAYGMLFQRVKPHRLVWLSDACGWLNGLPMWYEQEHNG